jgi:hypothetical protein
MHHGGEVKVLRMCLTDHDSLCEKIEVVTQMPMNHEESSIEVIRVSVVALIDHKEDSMTIEGTLVT